MKILKIDVGQPPVVKEMDNTLESIQGEVGGFFQLLYLQDGAILCCNDEGKINGMQPNRWMGGDIICGPFFIVGDDNQGEFASLQSHQIEYYAHQFAEIPTFTGTEPELKPYMEFYCFE